jgi:hypothetical protein
MALPAQTCSMRHSSPNMERGHTYSAAVGRGNRVQKDSSDGRRDNPIASGRCGRGMVQDV